VCKTAEHIKRDGDSYGLARECWRICSSAVQRVAAWRLNDRFLSGSTPTPTDDNGDDD